LLLTYIDLHNTYTIEFWAQKYPVNIAIYRAMCYNLNDGYSFTGVIAQ